MRKAQGMRIVCGTCKNTLALPDNFFEASDTETAPYARQFWYRHLFAPITATLIAPNGDKRVIGPLSPSHPFSVEQDADAQWVLAEARHKRISDNQPKGRERRCLRPFVFSGKEKGRN